jgi:hypothetical protein
MCFTSLLLFPCRSVRLVNLFPVLCGKAGGGGVFETSLSSVMVLWPHTTELRGSYFGCGNYGNRICTLDLRELNLTNLNGFRFVLRRPYIKLRVGIAFSESYKYDARTAEFMFDRT